MNDKLISSASGTLLSVIGMTTGILSTQSISEAFILGIIGGFAGYISKKIIDLIIKLITDLKRKR
jgi:ABC-type antimicrobial peptide transport system permease subunit